MIEYGRESWRKLKGSSLYLMEITPSQKHKLITGSKNSQNLSTYPSNNALLLLNIFQERPGIRKFPLWSQLPTWKSTQPAFNKEVQPSTLPSTPSWTVSSTPWSKSSRETSRSWCRTDSEVIIKSIFKSKHIIARNEHLHIFLKTLRQSSQPRGTQSKDVKHQHRGKGRGSEVANKEFGERWKLPLNHHAHHHQHHPPSAQIKLAKEGHAFVLVNHLKVKITYR